MLKRILVPLDGSPLAERALAVAAKLARYNGGELILVQALPISTPYQAWMPEAVTQDYEERVREAQAYLTHQAELPMLSGIPTATEVLSGVAAIAILNAAATKHADLVVMTSHGRTGFSHWVFGSVAEHVTRQAETPVLVLRQRRLPFWVEGAELVERASDVSDVSPASDKATIPDLRVLLPLDGSPLAENALEPAAICAESLVRGVEQATGLAAGSIGCRLHLVLIVRSFETLPENMPEALVVTGARSYLQQVAERVHAAHPALEVTWEVEASDDVAQSLVTLLQDDKDGKPYTLLAMATHGRTGIMRWIWGSITERVVHRTELPVLLVRPTADSLPSGSRADEQG